MEVLPTLFAPRMWKRTTSVLLQDPMLRRVTKKGPPPAPQLPDVLETATPEPLDPVEFLTNAVLATCGDHL